jgi:hypothetical protein
MAKRKSTKEQTTIYKDNLQHTVSLNIRAVYGQRQYMVSIRTATIYGQYANSDNIWSVYGPTIYGQ